MPENHYNRNRNNNNNSMTLLDSVIPFMWRLGTVVAGLVAVAVGFLYVKQDSLLYFPEVGGIPRRPRQNPRRYRSPQEHDLPFESHKITCSDGVMIHAWLILQPQPTTSTVPTILFFHGNAGNIGLRLPNAVQMYQHLKCNILMVEYRGYGDSDSVAPSEAGLKLDAEASLRFVLDHALLDSTQIFVFGRSLGGAVAFHLAQYAELHSMELAGLIVENTFLSISLMVDHLMPLVAPFKSLVLRIGWNSALIAPTLRVPILYLAGAQDQLVPHAHMLELYQLSQKTSKLPRIHIVENGTHNETWMQGRRTYWERFARFLAQVKAAQLQGHGVSYRTSTSNMSDISLSAAGDTSSSIVPGPATAPTSSMMTKTTKTAAVHMGDASTSSATIGTTTVAPLSSSSIPIMPTSLMTMAKEAVSMTSTLNTIHNKKKE